MDSLEDDLVFGLLRAAEDAAVAASRWVGRGDKEAADQAAVDAMRAGLARLPMDGRIVIGEGERDEAPMLYVGEELGQGGPAVDIALDPLEGTTITAKGGYGAMAVLAAAPRGGLLHAPDTYMDKLAHGPGFGFDVDLDADPHLILRAAAAAKGVGPSGLTICVLDRERHAAILDAARALDVRVMLIPDGDVAGAFLTADPSSGVDLYIGRGGAPEGVLAAAALRAVGGRFVGRLHFRNDEERARAARAGIAKLDRIYDTHELAPGAATFLAVGVTRGPMLDGVRFVGDAVETDALVLFPDGARRRICARTPQA